jgi:hypothetical protein
VDSTYFDGYMEKKDNHWYFSNGKSGEDGSCFFQVILLTRIRDKSNEEITMSADINTLSSCCDQYMFNDQEATGYISYGQPSFSHEYIDGNSPYLSIVVLKEDKPS